MFTGFNVMRPRLQPHFALYGTSILACILCKFNGQTVLYHKRTKTGKDKLLFPFVMSDKAVKKCQRGLHYLHMPPDIIKKTIFT